MAEFKEENENSNKKSQSVQTPKVRWAENQIAEFQKVVARLFFFEQNETVFFSSRLNTYE